MLSGKQKPEGEVRKETLHVILLQTKDSDYTLMFLLFFFFP